jgi:hypothetical protein
VKQVHLTTRGGAPELDQGTRKDYRRQNMLLFPLVTGWIRTFVHCLDDRICEPTHLAPPSREGWQPLSGALCWRLETQMIRCVARLRSSLNTLCLVA